FHFHFHYTIRNHTMKNAYDRIAACTLTVGQLKAQLEDFADDAIVIVACGYGDMGNTTQALPITDVETLYEEEGEYIEESGYSHSGFALTKVMQEEDEDEEELDDEVKAELENETEVVILRA